MQTLFTCSLNWKLRREHEVRPIPTRFPTNVLYAPLDNTPLNSLPNECEPVAWSAQLVAVAQPAPGKSKLVFTKSSETRPG